MIRALCLAAIAMAAVAFCPARARAVISSSDGVKPAARMASADVLEARQYCMPDSRVAGQESIRESVTVWEVTTGTWNGQSLQGLSLILVSRVADNDTRVATTNCYISHVASAAQRDALVDAFVTSQTISPGEATSWHLEPAVIRVEHVGDVVVVHLGLVA
jgi:hypothetical protein